MNFISKNELARSIKFILSYFVYKTYFWWIRARRYSCLNYSQLRLRVVTKYYLCILQSE